MTSKFTRLARTGLAFFAVLFCLSMGSATQAQNTQLTQGSGDIMPAMGTNTRTNTGTNTGTSTATARDYTVAPGEETHPPLRLTPDSTEMVKLDEDASSIIVGNPAHLNIMLNNPRLLLLAPRQPGATQFTILNNQGKVIMQRHVIVNGPKEQYVRIRRRCNVRGVGACEPVSVYYCPPGLCHDVRLMAGQGNNSGIPGGTIPSGQDGNGSGEEQASPDAGIEDDNVETSDEEANDSSSDDSESTDTSSGSTSE